MPFNINICSKSSLDSLKNILIGEKINYSGVSGIGSKKGHAIGTCLGGNMSLVYSLLGTDDQPDFRDTILFLEDIGESMYSIDRMCQAFRKAGIWEDISGLIIGNFSKLRQMESPYGISLEALFLEQLQFRKIPVLFDFPVGHEPNNLGMICGEDVELSILDSGGYQLSFNYNTVE
jgi:muramoyltetrapeptide carboxypeptidase